MSHAYPAAAAVTSRPHTQHPDGARGRLARTAQRARVHRLPPRVRRRPLAAAPGPRLRPLHAGKVRVHPHHAPAPSHEEGDACEKRRRSLKTVSLGGTLRLGRDEHKVVIRSRLPEITRDYPRVPEIARQTSTRRSAHPGDLASRASSLEPLPSRGTAEAALLYDNLRDSRRGRLRTEEAPQRLSTTLSETPREGGTQEAP